MLSLCGFLILIMIGFLFVRKENKSKIVNLIKENSPLVGMVLLLLFFFRGSVEGNANFKDGTNDSIINDDYSKGKKKINNITKGKGKMTDKRKMTDKKKTTTSENITAYTPDDKYSPVGN